MKGNIQIIEFVEDNNLKMIKQSFSFCSIYDYVNNFKDNQEMSCLLVTTIM